MKKKLYEKSSNENGQNGNKNIMHKIKSRKIETKITKKINK